MPIPDNKRGLFASRHCCVGQWKNHQLDSHVEQCKLVARADHERRMRTIKATQEARNALQDNLEESVFSARIPLHSRHMFSRANRRLCTTPACLAQRSRVSARWTSTKRSNSKSKRSHLRRMRITTGLTSAHTVFQWLCAHTRRGEPASPSPKLNRCTCKLAIDLYIKSILVLCEKSKDVCQTRQRQVAPRHATEDPV